MAEIATIARPYAHALFDHVIGSENATANLVTCAELLANLAAIAEHPEVISLIKNPEIPTSKVADIFISLLKSSITQEAKNFVRTLADNRRLLLLPEIAEQFTVLKNAHEGAADAVIHSAFELNEAQVTSLRTTLEAKFGRKLNPMVTVDPTLIGGVRVVVGDEVLDTSVRAKLQQMQVALTA